MASSTHLRTMRRCTALSVVLLSILPTTGCRKLPPPQPPLVGRWQGMAAAGGIVVPSVWEMRSDGTQSLTLTLPQGAMTAQGTWAAQGGILTERTTARIVVLGGERRTVALASPMETAFAYQLQGDTLTLTRPDTHQQIVLKRGVGTAGK